MKNRLTRKSKKATTSSSQPGRLSLDESLDDFTDAAATAGNRNLGRKCSTQEGAATKTKSRTQGQRKNREQGMIYRAALFSNHVSKSPLLVQALKKIK